MIAVEIRVCMINIPASLGHQRLIHGSMSAEVDYAPDKATSLYVDLYLDAVRRDISYLHTREECGKYQRYYSYDKPSAPIGIHAPLIFTFCGQLPLYRLFDMLGCDRGQFLSLCAIRGLRVPGDSRSLGSLRAILASGIEITRREYPGGIGDAVAGHLVVRLETYPLDCAVGTLYMYKRIGIDLVEPLVPEHLLCKEFLAYGVEDIDIAVETPQAALTEIDSRVALHGGLDAEVKVEFLKIQSIGETPFRHLSLVVDKPVAGGDAITYLSAVGDESCHLMGCHGGHTVTIDIELYHLGLFILACAHSAGKEHSASRYR